MFRGHIRRSGTLRSVWHRRERKRRPLDPRAADLIEQPRPTVRYRYRPTEAEWQSGDPGTMLRCLVRLATDRGSCSTCRASRSSGNSGSSIARAAGSAGTCCRLRWDVLPATGREAVEVVEQYADGLATAKHLRAARRSAEAVVRATRPVWAAGGFAPGAWDATTTARLVVNAAGVHARLRVGHAPGGGPAGGADQAALLRELFADPFRPVEIADRWLTGTVVTLARVIHADRAFALMPVLGDALQDAGCESAAVLGHCYGPGPHTAGCWLVDRFLRREGE